MDTLPEASGAILPPASIRVETALSRYPVHRLARHGEIAIDIREENESGEVSIRWEVDSSKKHGQPGPLAYKLDTLIINRRIEETARPIPRVIKLGSLREICRELGHSQGENVNTLRKALRQNAFAGITAKIRYRQTNGGERTLEADFTRYSVVFSGERLPNGREADAVYIVLNDIYMQVINGAITRPLDYDYLKSLPPAPQRFYELLSYQMYAAIKNDRAKAKLPYSEFCKYAPLTRHFDWERARSQLAKIHAPHKESGYIAGVEYRDAVDRDGRPDWIMLYRPGPKAGAEYRAFTKRGGPGVPEIEPPEEARQIAAPEPTGLERELIERGVTPAIAAELARDHAEEKIRAQLERLDWLVEEKPGKVDDPAAYLVGAIKNGYAAPKGFVPAAERQRRAEAKQAKERDADASRRRRQAEEARERQLRQDADAYWRSLGEGDRAALQAEADALADPGTLELEAGPFKRMGRKIRRDQFIRRLLADREPASADG